MVPLKLQIAPSFFLEEERDGYVVSAGMKQIWAVELDLLAEFARVCAENGLKWFVHAGTMLGAVRHQGFIPWDDDIDVVMPREDYDRLCKLAPTAFSHPYFFQCEDTDRYFARTFARRPPQVDTAVASRGGEVGRLRQQVRVLALKHELHGEPVLARCISRSAVDAYLVRRGVDDEVAGVRAGDKAGSVKVDDVLGIVRRSGIAA